MEPESKTTSALSQFLTPSNISSFSSGSNNSAVADRKEILRIGLNVVCELIDRLQKVGDRLEKVRIEEGKYSKFENYSHMTFAASVVKNNVQGGDSAAREAEFKKCLDAVSPLLPCLLNIYSDALDCVVSSDLMSNDSSISANTPFSLVPPKLSKNVSETGSIWVSKSASTSADFLRNNTSSHIKTLNENNEDSSSPEYLPKSQIISEMGVALICLLHLLPEKRLRSIILQISQTDICGNFNETSIHYITHLFIALQSFMKELIFPSSWIGANIIVNRITVRTLRAVSEVLKDELKNMFNAVSSTPPPDTADTTESNTMPMKSDINNSAYQLLWADYFRLLLELLNSKWVSVESFPAQRARAFYRLGGDVRGEAGELLRSMWEALVDSEKWNNDQGDGAVTIQMEKIIPNLVGPFLELTMSPHPKLRRAAVELIFK